MKNQIKVKYYRTREKIVSRNTYYDKLEQQFNIVFWVDILDIKQ